MKFFLIILSLFFYISLFSQTNFEIVKTDYSKISYKKKSRRYKRRKTRKGRKKKYIRKKNKNNRKKSLVKKDKNKKEVNKSSDTATSTEMHDKASQPDGENNKKEEKKSSINIKIKKKKKKYKKIIRNKKANDFKSKLALMLDYINKSIDVLKQQITDNPNAPFLADLYLELGNLYSQKSNTLYYIQMERMESDNDSGNQKKFSVVIEASKEAIAIYELLVRDFPEYHRIPEVLYLLALINSSIDNEAKFLVIAEKLVKTYPKSKEAMQARMLLGQFNFNKGNYSEALKFFTPVSRSSFNFVKNQAKYNMGQSYIRMDKPKKALKYYREVILDSELEKNGRTDEISIKNKSVNTSLKKDALIDSIRPFTIIYPNHKHPEIYYAKLAPSEILYQEVIEKLAFRYINLKKYQSAIKLLRVLSERTIDPEKVINIYQEVLTIIPLDKRINIKVEEIRFVLEKFYMWFSFYKINPKLKKVAKRFIEIQIRELGTRNHDIAKRTSGNKKERYLKKAEEFYLLYLGFFKKNRNTPKIAINLADVYYRLKMYPESGDYYLRVANHEFGKSQKSNKELIENALNSLQKEKTYTFYENTWRRGLLLSAVNTYFKLDPKKKKNDQLNFILAKTKFEQGMYDEALNDLYKFVKKFPNSKYVVDSGELILNYFNTSGDYLGLEKWSSKLLSLNFKDKNFKAKLEKIRKQAKLKTLDSDIQNDSDYNAFYQSRSYYKFAINTKDKELKNIALERALLKSREEKDIELFFKTANYLKSREKDKKKKLAIYNSIANEYVYLGRFPSALKTFTEIYKSGEFSEKIKKDAFIKSFSIVLALKYFDKYEGFIKNPYFKYVNEDLKEQLLQYLASAVSSGIKLDSFLIEYLGRRISDSAQIVSLYRIKNKLNKKLLQKINIKINSICKEDTEEAVCLWRYAQQLEKQKIKYLSDLKNASTSPDKIGKYGEGFVKLINPYSQIVQSDDSVLRVYIITQYMELYSEFAKYLNKVAQKNKDLKTALIQKANESLKTKEEYSKACKEIVKNSEIFIPVASYCDGKKTLEINKVFNYQSKIKPKISFTEYNKNEVLSFQKQMLVDKNGDTYLDLAEAYLSAKKYNLANATAIYGMSLFNEKSDNFSAILGCTSLNLGLLNEAKYYLLDANDYQDLKTKCLEELKVIEEEN